MLQNIVNHANVEKWVMDSEQDIVVDEATEVTEDTVLEPATAGERLRAAREAKRLELDHIAGETRIPIRHLESIENGEYEALPSRAYAIGFSKTYAKAVGLDPDAITDAVREELAQGHERATALAGGMEPGDPGKLPSAGLAWAGGIAAIILAVGVVFFYSTYFGAGTGPASLLAESDEAAEELVVEAAPVETVPAGAPSPDGQVVLTATGGETWVRFFVDGGDVLFEGVMENGDTYEVPSNIEDVRLNTGQPNMFAVTIDGQSVPPISEEMVPVGDAPVSAEALLARADIPAEANGDAPDASGPVSN